MSSIVRTIHTTHPLLKISKMVAVLLLIFLPVLASANPVYQSSNRYSNPSTVGASSMQYQLESYKMANTSTYQVGTTYNPAQTVYEPFSTESPSSYPPRISGRRNGEEDATDGDIIIEGEHTGNADPNLKPESPLGDAWSLLIFAAMAAVVITLRKKQTA